MKKYWILIVALVLLVLGAVVCVTNGGVIDLFGYRLPFFSSGDYAMGVFSAGTFSIGIFSIGIFSIGIFSVGIFNVGLYALGFFVYAWKKKHPVTANVKEKV